MRLASTQVVAQAVTQAKVDLDRAVKLWEYVAEQKLLKGLPAHNPDPVPDTEAFARRNLESRDRRAQLTLLDAMHRLRGHMAGAEDAIKRIRTARVALGAQVPAVDAALNAHEANGNKSPNRAGVGPDGRVGTSGVSLEEADRQRKGAVEAETACVCCDLGVSEVGRLKAGLCPADYKAWQRAGYTERGPWILERRRYLDAKSGEGVVVPLRAVDPGVYKNLKDVA